MGNLTNFTVDKGIEIVWHCLGINPFIVFLLELLKVFNVFDFYKYVEGISELITTSTQLKSI